MAKTLDISQATQQLYGLLNQLADGTERQRAITAALTLFGESYVPVAPPAAPGGAGAGGAGGGAGAGGGQQSAPGSMTARDFFDAKKPKGKIEELAVGARYREQYQSATSHTRDEFEAVNKAAKRAFDRNNFYRDLDNAKKAGLINKGKENALSHTGERYVDLLPDRAAARAAKKESRTGRGRGKKKAAKKAR